MLTPRASRATPTHATALLAVLAVLAGLAGLAAITVTATAAARAPRAYPAGCLRQADVAIGYYPYEVAWATGLLVAPHDQALARHQLPAGRRFGVQTVPNPEHLSDPGIPAATNGYLWGYAKRGGRSGWVLADALTRATPEDPWAYGPAGVDFQAGDDFPDDDAIPRFVLGHPATGTAVVTARTVYERWAPRSSPMALLLQGQAVQLRWRASGHYCADADGRRGWIPAHALRRTPR